MKIIIAECDEQLRGDLADCLSGRGHVVIEATCVQQAIDSFTAHQDTQLVIACLRIGWCVDDTQPHRTARGGLVVISHLRAISPVLDFCLISEDLTNDAIHFATRFDACTFQKPFDFEEFCTILKL